MKIKTFVGVSALATALVGCGGGGGDINISPSTVDNSVDNSTSGGGSGESNPCASFELDGNTFQGRYDGTNCTYDSSFVDFDNPLMVDLNIPKITGVHIFEGSLFVGKNFSTNADLEAAGITRGGDGPTLTIQPGNTLAFLSSDDFMVINRGSQIEAVGTASLPITVTSYSDAVSRTVGAEDVSEWGGLIINGFSLTNKCTYTGSATEGTLAKEGECSVAAEGKSGAAQTHYGGDILDDNSGTLKYFIVKHTGAEVEADNELNGISFDAVGSGTTVDYLEAYSTFDDGVEMFGGSVNISHYVALYVRDDSIDIDEGFQGSFEYALVIQSEADGNRCIESDGIGSYSSKEPATIADFIDRGLNSRATIRNLTCIVSPEAVGTHDPGQGWKIREAHFPTLEYSLITTAYLEDEVGGTDDNYCVSIANEGLQAAQDGDMTIGNNIIACQDLTDGKSLPDGTTVEQWLKDSGNDVYQTAEAGEDPTASDNPALVILNGFYSLPKGDMIVNSAPITVDTESNRDFIGAVTADDDWTANWTYGLHEGKRGQALWFE